MSARLSTLAPDLVTLLGEASETELRTVSQEVVNSTLERNGLHDPRIDAALATLRRASFGETAERNDLKAFEEELDNIAWDIQDRVEQGDAPREDYLRAFARARTAATLWFALDRDPLQAALESTYEACAATSQQEVRTIVSDALTT